MDIHKKFFSKIGFNYLILGIITLIFQIIILNIINLTNPQYLTDINIISIVSTICNYILPFPIFSVPSCCLTVCSVLEIRPVR